ncbi:microtubule-associated protein 10-like [Montipora capricornis]|uniref:microtubule-associated protein 10-like n=1 Tax=Montipora capricornis TaxID=246305 RepID=UPI0035F1D47B
MSETLFSLEVHLESVGNLRVPCKLPAVCFRLLDFPTMIIHHIPTLRAEKLRQKLSLEDKETMLDDLKDRFGHFQFHKGKSCLFKASIDAMLVQLQSVPLYVMLMDMWPKKPALVGSTLIPLKEAINKISVDVNQKGIEVPSFYRDEGEFDVYNLMGSCIASVKLAYRFLSLGGSLIPHIPTAALTTKTTKSESEEITQAPKDAVDNGHPGRKSKEFEEGIPRESTRNKSNSKMVKDVQKKDVKHNAEVQTNILAKDIKSSRGRDKSRQKTEDDFVITNTICPPPLYYNHFSNSTALSKSVSAVMEDPIRERNGGSSIARRTQMFHSDDKLSDVDFVYHDPTLLQTDGTVRLASVSVQTDEKLTTFGGEKTHVEVSHGLYNLQNLTSDGQLPVLRALLHELSCLTRGLHGMDSTEAESGQHQLQSTALHEQPHVDRTQKHGSQTKSKPPLSKNSQMHEKQTKEFRTSKRAQTSVIGLPRHRVRFKQTKLTYGMTKTQKMRLQLNQRNMGDSRTRLCDDQSLVPLVQENLKEDSKKRALREDRLGKTYRIGSSKRSTVKELKQTADVEIQTLSQSSNEQLAQENDATQESPTEIREDFEKQDFDVYSTVERNGESPNSLEVFIPQVEGEPDEENDQEGECVIDQQHPVGTPLDGFYGQTGIINSEHDEIRGESAMTMYTEDFEGWEAESVQASLPLAFTRSNSAEVESLGQRSHRDTSSSAHSENSSASSTRPVKSSRSPVTKSGRRRTKIEETRSVDHKISLYHKTRVVSQPFLTPALLMYRTKIPTKMVRVTLTTSILLIRNWRACSICWRYRCKQEWSS